MKLSHNLKKPTISHYHYAFAKRHGFPKNTSKQSRNAFQTNLDTLNLCYMKHNFFRTSTSNECKYQSFIFSFRSLFTSAYQFYSSNHTWNIYEWQVFNIAWNNRKAIDNDQLWYLAVPVYSLWSLDHFVVCLWRSSWYNNTIFKIGHIVDKIDWSVCHAVPSKKIVKGKVRNNYR